MTGLEWLTVTVVLLLLFVIAFYRNQRALTQYQAGKLEALNERIERLEKLLNPHNARRQ